MLVPGRGKWVGPGDPQLPQTFSQRPCSAASAMIPHPSPPKGGNRLDRAPGAKQTSPPTRPRAALAAPLHARRGSNKPRHRRDLELCWDTSAVEITTEASSVVPRRLKLDLLLCNRVRGPSKSGDRRALAWGGLRQNELTRGLRLQFESDNFFRAECLR